MQENGYADVFEVIQHRRSVRSFKPTPVPQEHLLRILAAARLAPTSGNQQPWRFLVIQQREKLDLLQQRALEMTLEMIQQQHNLAGQALSEQRERVGTYLGGFLSAPVCVVVLVDRQSSYPQYNQHDGPLAAANLMLAARALGYGTVYGTDAIPEQALREVLAIPQQYEITCTIPLGAPTDWPTVPEKRTLSDVIVWERFEEE